MTTTFTHGDGTNVAIRQAEQVDLLDVFRIEQASFPQPWPYAAFEIHLDTRGFLVAHDRTTVVGYVVADVVPSYTSSIGHIKDIAVAPEYRGMGIGRCLLGRGLAILESNAVKRVKLEVRESNEIAIALYSDFEFEPQRTVPGYYEDGEAALVMVRSCGDG